MKKNILVLCTALLLQPMLSAVSPARSRTMIKKELQKANPDFGKMENLLKNVAGIDKKQLRSQILRKTNKAREMVSEQITEPQEIRSVFMDIVEVESHVTTPEEQQAAAAAAQERAREAQQLADEALARARANPIPEEQEAALEAELDALTATTEAEVRAIQVEEVTGQPVRQEQQVQRVRFRQPQEQTVVIRQPEIQQPEVILPTRFQGRQQIASSTEAARLISQTLLKADYAKASGQASKEQENQALIDLGDNSQIKNLLGEDFVKAVAVVGRNYKNKKDSSQDSVVLKNIETAINAGIALFLAELDSFFKNADKPEDYNPIKAQKPESSAAAIEQAPDDLNLYSQRTIIPKKQTSLFLELAHSLELLGKMYDANWVAAVNSLRSDAFPGVFTQSRRKELKNRIGAIQKIAKATYHLFGIKLGARDKNEFKSWRSNRPEMDLRFYQEPAARNSTILTLRAALYPSRGGLNKDTQMLEAIFADPKLSPFKVRGEAWAKELDTYIKKFYGFE